MGKKRKMLDEKEIRTIIMRVNKRIADLNLERQKRVREAEEERFAIETGKKKVNFPGTRISNLTFTGIGESLQIDSLENFKAVLLFILGEEKNPVADLLK